MKENFEQAYIESQARIALVLAESLGLISEKEEEKEAPEDHPTYIQRTKEALDAYNRAERKRLGVKPYPSSKKLQAMERARATAGSNDNEKT